MVGQSHPIDADVGERRGDDPRLLLRLLRRLLLYTVAPLD
jgi:hypothetical protein